VGEKTEGLVGYNTLHSHFSFQLFFGEIFIVDLIDGIRPFEVGDAGSFTTVILGRPSSAS
jgi:hypothetical protein